MPPWKTMHSARAKPTRRGSCSRGSAARETTTTVIAMTAEATHRPAVAELFIVFRTLPELNHVKNQADAECRKEELARSQEHKQDHPTTPNLLEVAQNSSSRQRSLSEWFNGSEMHLSGSSFLERERNQSYNS
jgi:hypothetical protein